MTDVLYSPDGSCIASGSRDNTVKVWDASSYAGPCNLCEYEHGIRSIGCCSDGKRIVSGSDSGITIWDAESGRALVRLKQRRDTATDQTLLARHPYTFNEKRCHITRIARICDHWRIVSGTPERITVWEVDENQVLGKKEKATPGCEGIVFAENLFKAASWSGEEILWVWNLWKGKEPVYLRAHTSSVTSAAFSPNGKQIVSGSSDGSARIWNVENGDMLLCLRGHEGGVYSVAYSPTGQRIVTGSSDCTVRIWSADTGDELLCLHGHECGVEVVNFSYDGQRIGSVDSGPKFHGMRNFRIWDADTGECLEVSEFGGDDFSLIAAVILQRPFRMISHESETVIQHADTKEPIAWFPMGLLDNVICHPASRVWVVALRGHLCILKLQGNGDMPLMEESGV